MLFNSYIFWVFFAVVILLYRFLPHRGQNRMLLIASYVFYGWWDWRFLLLIFISTFVDFFMGIGIADSSIQKRKKLFLGISCCANLCLLGTFKYYGFFATEFLAFLNYIHIPASLPMLHIILPVGISFYTFQTMSYTIDVYRGITRPTRNFLDFALYVSFFPQLVAGPIERSSRLMPQIITPRSRNGNVFKDGLYLVLIGLFKKIIIADNMATIVNLVFAAEPSSLSGPEVLMGVYAFALQIYGDFSGYSSIARGVAKWLGFDLMVNFRMPYLARNPREFWQRWHISLSTWLRDYLYIPFGGNRKGRFKTYRNLMLTMFLGGLWHGAGWTFVLWGVFHGLLLCVDRIIWQRKDVKDNNLSSPAWKQWMDRFLMFHLVCLGWLLFRAESTTQVFLMLQRIFLDFTLTSFAQYTAGMILFFSAPLLLFEYWTEVKGDLMQLTRVHWIYRSLVYSYFVIMLWFFLPRAQHEFIYFQF